MLSKDELHAIDVLVGKNIENIRKKAGKTQTDLARLCGISFQQIQKYEMATNRVAASRLVQISQVLNIEVCELFEPE